MTALGCRLSGTKKSHHYKGKQERLKEEQKTRYWLLLNMNVPESGYTLREMIEGDKTSHLPQSLSDPGMK